MKELLNLGRASVGALLIACGALLGASCGDDEGDPKDTGDAGTGGDDKPIYLMVGRLFAEDSILQYAKLTNELNLNLSVKDLADAREFPGFSSFRVHDGYVYVGDEETPTVTKYEITSDLKWKQIGNSLNFGNYVTEGGVIVNATRGDDVYLYYGTDNTARVLYNLDSWKILGSYEDTRLPDPKDGWVLTNRGTRNRTNFAKFPGVAVWPFDFAEDEEATGLFSKREAYLAVYDSKTNAEKSVIKTECLNPELMSSDEEGNVYFSTMFQSPVFGLYGLNKPNCVVRVKPDGTLDEEFGEKVLADFTDGEDHGSNFVYLKNGKAIASFLDTSRLVEASNADFSGPLQTEVLCRTTWTCDEEFAELWDGTLWSQRIIDLETGTSKPVTGYKAGHDPDNYYSSYFQIDDRIFTFIPVEEGRVGLWYEIDPDTAKVQLTTMRTESGVGEEIEVTAIVRVR